jgi:hypothetical protein
LLFQWMLLSKPGETFQPDCSKQVAPWLQVFGSCAIAGPVAPTVASPSREGSVSFLITNSNKWSRTLLKLELHLPYSNPKVQRLKRCTYLFLFFFFGHRCLEPSPVVVDAGRRRCLEPITIAVGYRFNLLLLLPCSLSFFLHNLTIN